MLLLTSSPPPLGPPRWLLEQVWVQGAAQRALGGVAGYCTGCLEWTSAVRCCSRCSCHPSPECCPGCSPARHTQVNIVATVTAVSRAMIEGSPGASMPSVILVMDQLLQTAVTDTREMLLLSCLLTWLGSQ
jgi:hypothetical protein